MTLKAIQVIGVMLLVLVTSHNDQFILISNQQHDYGLRVTICYSNAKLNYNLSSELNEYIQFPNISIYLVQKKNANKLNKYNLMHEVWI